MTVRQRRRRGVVLLALAVACGGLAASAVSSRTDALERQIGTPVPVVVAARDLEAGAELGRGDLTVAQVPGRYAPPDAPTAPAQAVGLTTAGPVAAGSPITAGVVGRGADGAPGTGLRAGERAADVAVVASGVPLTPGSRVDVVVTTDPSDGPGESFVALEDVELLAVGPPAGTGPTDLDGADAGLGPSGAGLTATLRVSARQAVYLAAAQSFARELRLLPRPPGDRRGVGRSPVPSNGL